MQKNWMGWVFSLEWRSAVDKRCGRSGPGIVGFVHLLNEAVRARTQACSQEATGEAASPSIALVACGKLRALNAKKLSRWGPGGR